MINSKEKTKLNAIETFRVCAITVDEYPNAKLVYKGVYDAVLDILNKQVPAKPKTKVRHGQSPRHDFYCPFCMKLFGAHSNYCPDCGQAIEWKYDKGIDN